MKTIDGRNVRLIKQPQFTLLSQFIKFGRFDCAHYIVSLVDGQMPDDWTLFCYLDNEDGRDVVSGGRIHQLKNGKYRVVVYKG